MKITSGRRSGSASRPISTWRSASSAVPRPTKSQKASKPAGRRRRTSAWMAGRLLFGRLRGLQVVDERLQDAVPDEDVRAPGETLVVVGRRAEHVRPHAVVDHLDARIEDPLAALVADRARARLDCLAGEPHE